MGDVSRAVCLDKRRYARCTCSAEPDIIDITPPGSDDERSGRQCGRRWARTRAMREGNKWRIRVATRAAVEALV